MVDPEGPDTGDKRVVRGGCWMDYAHGCRVSDRWECNPEDRKRGIGLRVVYELKKTDDNM